MKSFKILMGSFALSIMLFASCTKEQDEPQYSSDDEMLLNVNTDSKQLTASRMKYIYMPVFDTTYQNFYNSTNTLKNSLDIIPNPSHQFILVGEIASPVRSGNRVLSATHVEVLGNKAYVSYHYNEQSGSGFTGGDLYEGQIDVIDITDPSLPVILQSAIPTKKADFNSMTLDLTETNGQRKLWVAATDFGVGGAIYQLTLQNGEIPSPAVMYRTKTPPGKSSNSVARAATWLFATAGRTAGGLFTFDASNMHLENTIEFPNAKYNAVTGQNIGDKNVVLKSGNTAEIQVYEISQAHTLLNTFSIGSIQPEDGKSVLYVKDNLAWVAMGYEGVKAFDLNTGAVVHSLSPSNMAPECISNGVSIDEDYVYIANGSGGLYLCKIIPGQQELSVVGIYKYGASANYVMAKNNYIFIANGREGLKILHKVWEGDYNVICDYDEFGVPVCLEPNPEPICPTLMNTLQLALPSNQNAMVNHPEYFINPNHNIVLNAPATIYFTFIDEGAGMKNSYGIYWYNASNPPTSVAQIKSTKTLLFPNASKVNSGGNLVAGHTIHMVGTFSAGTSIGSFLVVGGWAGVSPSYPTGLSEGYYTHYSDMNLNLNGGQQQSLLFYDAACDNIILTFEDVLIPGGDKDFNDVIIKIAVDPPTAVDPSLYIPL